MKSKIILILLAIVVTNAAAQRDTLDLSTIYDSDTATVDKIATDSVLVFTGIINGVEYSTTYRVNVGNVLQDTMTAILDSIAILQAQKEFFVEEYFRLYQETNSKLWNLQRQYARIEEVFNALYIP